MSFVRNEFFKITLAFVTMTFVMMTFPSAIQPKKLVCLSPASL